MLIAHMGENVIFRCLGAETKGYVSKNSNLLDLVKAIHMVDKRDLWVERKIISRLFYSVAVADDGREERNGKICQDGLTLREREVLKCLTKGSVNKEITEPLCVMEKKVKSHLYSMLRKPNVTRHLEATIWTVKRGLD